MTATADTSHWQRVQQLFDAAVERPVRERDAFVEAEAGDGATADALRRLLAIHDDYLTTRGAAPEASFVAQALSRFVQDEHPATGTVVGGYRIDARLGSGGMGSVYLAARDVGGREQQVALKIVPFALRHGRVGEHLRRERAILAGLEHPHIARLIDAGELDDGRPYFAMEYVDGERITQYCRKRALGLRSRLALFLDVCDAVAYAHRRLVLHRDLKPGNILVDREGRVRLLDFGIAKAMDGVTAGPRDATLDGGFFSPDCAAPEQATGRPTGVATDVYALGCLLYELLCGQRPFDFSGLARAQIVERIVTQAAPRLGPSLPPGAARFTRDLDAIVAKTLRKTPDERYGSVDALAADLRNLLADRPIALRTRERWYRLRCFVRRHRVAAAAAMLAALVAVIAGIMTIEQSRRVSAAREAAERQRDHAQGVVAFLVNVFDAADPLSSPGHELRAGELLERAAQRFSQGRHDDPELTATVAQMLVYLFFRMQRYDLAKPQMELAREAMTRLPDPTPELRVQHAIAEGQLAYADTRYEDAERWTREALVLIDNRPQGGAEATLRLVRIRANSLLRLGRVEEAIVLMRGRLDEISRRTDLEPGQIDTLTQLLCRVLGNNGRADEALSRLEPLLASQLQRLTEDDAGVIATLHFIGVAYGGLRRYPEAVDFHRRAIDAFLRSYGERPVQTTPMYSSLATIYLSMGQAQEAEETVWRILHLLRTLKVGRHEAAYAYDQLAQVEALRGDYAKAESHSRVALLMSPPNARRNNAYIELTLAETLSFAGRPFESEHHALAVLPYFVGECETRKACAGMAHVHAILAYDRFARYDFDGARTWLTPPTLTTLRVLSVPPYAVWRRAETMAKVLGIDGG